MKTPREAAARSRFAKFVISPVSKIALFGGKCLLLAAYIAGVWAFGIYDSQIATPWTLGFGLLWAAFGLLTIIAAGALLAITPVLSVLSVLGLVIAAPYYPEAWAVLVTLVFGFFMGSPMISIPLLVIAVGTVLIYYLNTGTLSL